MNSSLRAPATRSTSGRAAEERGPDEVLDEFGAALRAGDVAPAAAHFSREACFVTLALTVISGRSALRGFLRQFVDIAGDLRIEQHGMRS